ncbi:hypothetical protein [Rhodococcus sp. IEGM 1379]|uniref:hypothetical protein n=1 Tax=Rhodococcus sp. IEGM 1379 TaxID=3047086 RepID=UPI0024B69EF5|nr:hypothetical protein [Rhodococcus sp. IEGM 1379]MDI9916848.1 hypothetical protein [Rhodococcus sp. IEGM 1379]
MEYSAGEFLDPVGLGTPGARVDDVQYLISAHGRPDVDRRLSRADLYRPDRGPV